MPDPCDVLVVGGGIGGAVLGELLARAGKRVVVLERSTGPAGGGVGGLTRPEILWPRTVNLLTGLLGRDTVERELTLPLRGIRAHDGRQWADLATDGSFRRAGVTPAATEPARTRATLLSRASFELRRAVEFLEPLRDGDRIVGGRVRNIATGRTEDLAARLVVGDDGSNSRVRSACGIDLRLRPFPLDFLCFGFPWPSDLPAATANIWMNLAADGSGIAGAAAVPFPDGNGGGLVLVRPWALRDRARLEDGWKRFTARAVGIAPVLGDRRFPDDLVHVQRVWGHAGRYGAPGALIIGDAAHPVSPAGGQGANMSVADARVAAAAIIAGEPDVAAAVLERRRQANDRSLAFTRGASLLLRSPRWLRPAWEISFVLKLVARRPGLAARALRYVASAFDEHD